MHALRRVSQSSPAQCERLASTAALQQVQVLPAHDLETFRQRAFLPALPAILLRYNASHPLPAIKKWFTASTPPELQVSYLARFSAVPVPLEFSDGKTFARAYHSLSFFLECDYASRSTSRTDPSRFFSARVPGQRAVHRQKDPTTFFTPKIVDPSPQVHIYLAQAPIAELPRALQSDLPIPPLIKQAGKGDVYDSSIWIGRVPTYTPLHKDPNPNLFVQLTGRKVVRMFRPDVGRAIFAKVQESIGGSASESMRGEEMMQGRERTMLEHEVWAEGSEYKDLALEAELSSGDALFIPKGWWHSVRGVGTGINGSVNWWFR